MTLAMFYMNLEVNVGKSITLMEDSLNLHDRKFVDLLQIRDQTV